MLGVHQPAVVRGLEQWSIVYLNDGEQSYENRLTLVVEPF